MTLYPKKVVDILSSDGSFSNSINGNEINLRQKDTTNNVIESPIDDMVSKVIAEPISDKDMLEAILNAEHDPIVELAKAGGVISKVHKSFEVQPQRQDDGFYDKIISHIQAPITAHLAVSSPAPIKSQAKAGFIVKEELIMPAKEVLFKPLPTGGRASFNFAPPKKKYFPKLFFVIFAVMGVFAYGFTLKSELVHDGSMAFDNIKKAQADLEHFDFTGAAISFQKSYENFTKASQNLNLVGAGLIGIIGDIPGMGKVRSAKDITEAGKLLSVSGKAMSEALAALAQTGTVLDPRSGGKVKPFKIVSQLKTALELSSRNFAQAKALIAGIDEAVIPEDKKSAFLDFRDKIPLLEKTLSDAVGYTDFLGAIIGIDQPKKYLLLFNNNSELRPTGGFPGTYGVVSFSGGGLSDFFVNDVYNLDGQLKRNVIPPKQLQHITPTWGMRDASWFIDFPDSARKVMSFFAEEAGYEVSGVITLNPDIVSGILAVVGPISMPEYDLILTADNFLENVQEEVEYGPNRTQPKKVVADFAPRFLEKLYSADSEKWMKIFNVFIAGLEERDIQFYFNNKELEKFAVEEGFGGEVKNVAGDYLTINLTNIKGSKTDTVTDSSVVVEGKLENGQVIHKVILARAHKGGDEKHGFYNRQNPTYVRVLIPNNAELLEISGNDLVNFKPLVSYNGISFEKDKDLERYEAGFNFDKSLGVDRFEESGKQGIGFWMITDPGMTKKVEFEYSIPASEDYSFYFQKQSGLDWKNFKFTFDAGDKQIMNTSPELNKIGKVYVFDEELKKDMEIKIKTK